MQMIRMMDTSLFAFPPEAKEVFHLPSLFEVVELGFHFRYRFIGIPSPGCGVDADELVEKRNDMCQTDEIVKAL